MSVSKEIFNRLLWYVADNLDIPKGYKDRAEQRYNGIGDWLLSPESSISEMRPRIYPQGSLVLGTIIRPFDEHGSYDVDLICEVDFPRISMPQSSLKQLVGKAIGGYAKRYSMNNDPEEGRHCWILNYSDEVNFHMDLVPAVETKDIEYRTILEQRGIVGNYLDLAIGITDNKNQYYNVVYPNWPHSNPRGYAKWFDERKRTKMLEEATEMFKAARGSQSPFPEDSPKVPLQAAIQIIKRFRDVLFGDNSDKPASIILTTAAGLVYAGQGNLLDTLLSLGTNLMSPFSLESGQFVLRNPVDASENLTRKWAEANGSVRLENFKLFSRELGTRLTHLSQATDESAALRMINEYLGDEYSQTAARRLSESRELADKRISAPSVVIHPTVASPRHEIVNPTRPWRA